MVARSNMRKGKKLTAQQKKAVDAYFRNGYKMAPALVLAGYAETTARHAANAIFSNPAVQAEINRRHEAARRKYEVDEDWVVQRLARIANGGEVLAKFKKVNEQGMLYWDFTDATPDELAVVTELTTDEYTEGRGDDKVALKKIKVGIADPKGALDSLARKLGLFNDKVQVSGEVSLIERLQRGRERVKAGGE